MQLQFSIKNNITYFLLVSIMIANLQTLKGNQDNSDTKKVFGYLVDWEYIEGNHQYIRYDYLTHLACFDFCFDSTGSFPSAENNYPYNWPWTDVINQCRMNNVKLIMSVAEFDSNKIHSVITNDTIRVRLIEEVVRLMREYDFDGVNIDFESLKNEDEGEPVIDFMKEVTDSVHANIIDSETSFSVPVKNWDNHWDFNSLAEVCDYLFVMGYNYFGEWSDPGPTSPLTAQSWSELNLTYAMDVDYREAIENYADRIILGLPYFGEYWTASSAEQGDTNSTYVSYVPFRDLESYSPYMNEEWDELYNTSWYWWDDSTNNVQHYHQIWIDNKESLGKKIDLALQKGLGGIGIWSLGLDGAKPDFWELIDEKILDPVSIENDEIIITDYILQDNYPNPFNPSTNISFYLPGKGNAELIIYNITGEQVITLLSGDLNAGWHKVNWGAENKYGRKVSSGVYIYQLSHEGTILRNKMMLVK